MPRKPNPEPRFRRAPATFRPESLNVEERTVDVIWSTGAGVERRDIDGPYLEVLSMDPAHVDLKRLQGGAVLNGHRSDRLTDVIGVVLSAEIRDGMGVATIRLSARDDVDGILRDIADGIVRHVSIGYRVEKWEISHGVA